jgi:hypothetical protein
MKSLTRGETVDFWSVQAWILTSESYPSHVVGEDPHYHELMAICTHHILHQFLTGRMKHPA